jgi:hypothetical protein
MPDAQMDVSEKREKESYFACGRIASAAEVRSAICSQQNVMRSSF